LTKLKRVTSTSGSSGIQLFSQTSLDYYDRMRPKISFFLPLLLSLGLTVQAQASTDIKAGTPATLLDSALFYQVLMGELNAYGDDPAAGYALMLDAARKVNDAKLFHRAVQIALQAHSGESALLAAKAWSQAQPNSYEANNYVLQVMLGLNRTAETEDVLRRTIALARGDDRRNVMWSVPAMYERISDKALAASVVKKSLAPFLQDPLVGSTAWAVVGRMAMIADDKAGALTAAATAISMDSRSEHAALLALSMMSSEVVTAEVLVQQHLPSARPEFRITYIKALLSAKRDADAKAQLDKLQVQVPDFPDTWLVKGALAFQAGQIEPAKQQLHRYLELTEEHATSPGANEHSRGRAQAFFSLSQIAQQEMDWSQARAWLARVDDPRELLRAQIRLAALMAQQGELDAALELINSQPERSEMDAQMKRSAQVQLLKDQRQFARARDLVQVQLSQSPDDPDLMYDLAMLQERQGELDNMEQLLRRLIAVRPTDPQAYNALGYALADRGLRLADAKVLIAKAAELAPNDAYIQDSLAWVEFRLGNLSLAAELLQKAFKDKPDPEIAAHLGEVLWTMKRPEQAIDVWRRGEKLAPDNETLLNTLKRLQVSL
jgi:tetratricopeptide (TPR) repeat protein